MHTYTPTYSLLYLSYSSVEFRSLYNQLLWKLPQGKMHKRLPSFILLPFHSVNILYNVHHTLIVNVVLCSLGGDGARWSQTSFCNTGP